MIGERLVERTSRGLAQAVHDAVADGTLSEGMRLPPIRSLALQLGLSPSTVSAAWEQLSQARAIRTDGRRGTTIAPLRVIGPARYRRALERSASFALDLSTGVPDASLLPDLTDALRGLHHTWTPGNYLVRPVIDDLEEVLRRDWPYAPEGMTIVDGAMDALDQVSSLLLRPGGTVVVEHPSFPPLLDLLDALGVRTIGVDVDERGMLPGPLAAAMRSNPEAVFLQPRAQNPTGASMDPDRAEQLADVLRAGAAMVVEDDSAGAVSSWPPVSLARWLPERTVHVRSFSKSHGPDLRLAAVSGPEAVIGRLMERRLLGQGWTSWLLQTVLLDLLTSRAARAQVKRARYTYARRRESIVKELERLDIPVAAPDGLNLWLPVRDEPAALLHLATNGVGAAAGSPFATRQNHAPHLRVTVGLVTGDARPVAELLAQAARAAPWSGPR